MSDQVQMQTHAPVVEIRGSMYADTYVTVDGEPFPWPIYGIKWEMNLKTGLPKLTFSIEAESILINNTWPKASDE